LSPELDFKEGHPCIIESAQGPFLGCLLRNVPYYQLAPSIVVKQPGVVAIVVLQCSPLQLAVLLFEVKELGVVAIVVL
jgi:hypothetical protein